MKTFLQCIAVPRPTDRNPSSGIALFGLMMILGTLSLVGVTVYTIVKSNVQVTGHFKQQQEAFHQADGGLQYVASRINADIQSGALTLGAATVTVNYPAPSGYTFDTVTSLTQLADPDKYLVEVVGRSGEAASRIEAVLGKKGLLNDIGVFGDDLVRAQPGFDVYSYDSDVTPFPTPSDSTGQAGVGSNISAIVQPGTTVDGTILLGATAGGTPGTYSGPSTIPSQHLGRVQPDPLGAIGGELANSFTYFSNAANNDNATAGIVGDAINMGPGTTLTLDGGVYYLDEMILGSHADLTFNGTIADPVVIFLKGEFRTQSNSDTVNAAGNPKSLYIFSDSSDIMRVQPNNHFMGIVYAPYAELRFQPNNDVYGLFWGNNVLLQPGGNLYIDMSGLNEFVSGTLTLVNWKEVR